MARPAERLLEKLKDVKKTISGWSARCPAHDDQRASLSIGEGQNGRAIIKCHAGCTAKAIVEAVDWTLSDLMRTADTSCVDNANVNGNRRKPKRIHISLTNNKKSAAKVFATSATAVASLERHHGPRSALWTYHDVAGEPAGVVVRWDLADGKKEFRPVSRHGDRWRIGGMTEPRPLYGLPGLVKANRVYICEGEKAADAVRALGLTATTSAHGCESFGKTNWQPLAGKEIIILPDHDTPGQTYADGVAAILATLTPAPIVKLVELPNLPEHGDAADYVMAHADLDPVELRRIFDSLADEAEPMHLTPPLLPTNRYVPFPVDALPEPVRSFVLAGAAALGCDPCYLAVPLLTVLAAAIGNTRRIELKRSWTAPATLWTAIVGESGTAKTPAFKLVMQAIGKLERKAQDSNAQAMREYEAKLLQYDKELAQWKQGRKQNHEPPEKPEAPRFTRFAISNITVEALAPILLDNPRGLLLARDELAAWLGSFDRYARGKGGADAANWLSLHDGDNITVDRKTGIPRTISISQALVSICGGIQPAVLHRALGIEHRESGLAARLLLAWPPRRVKRWTEADIDLAAEVRIAQLVDRLYDLKPTTAENGGVSPVVFALTPDAKVAWKDYHNLHAEEQIDLDGELSAAWSKLEEYAARLALVIHCARWAADDPTLARADAVDVESMAAGITLATWFKGEARRVYALLGETDGDRDKRQLVEWIERRGRAVTPRDVQMGCRWLRGAGAAEAALAALVKTGMGYWDPTPAGQRGQPTRYFHLSTLSTVNGNRVFLRHQRNNVDVDKG